MRSVNLHGVFIPLITPLTGDGTLNEPTLRHLVQHLAPDVQGFVVNGTTSDFPLLSPEERARAVQIVREEVGGQRIVIAGTGAVGTRETIALTREAHAIGADAVLVIMPFYIRPTSAGLRQHFAAIAEAVPDLPVLLYNFPKLVGRPIPVDVIAVLCARHANVAGIKDSSGDLPYTLSVIENTGDAFQTLVGHGAMLLPALAMGAAGGIVAAGNLIPRAYRRLFDAVKANDWNKAREIQSRIYPVARMISQYGSLTARAGLELQGFDVGMPRPPLTLEGTFAAHELETLRVAMEVANEV